MYIRSLTAGFRGFRLPLAQGFEQGFLVLASLDGDDIHADVVRCVERGPDQPVAGRHHRLFGHASDLRCIVVIVFNNIVYKFHTFLLHHCYDDPGNAGPLPAHHASPVKHRRMIAEKR